MFFYLTNKKKWIGQQSEDIIGYEHKEWTDPIQRFKNISDFVNYFDKLNTFYKNNTLNYFTKDIEEFKI